MDWLGFGVEAPDPVLAPEVAEADIGAEAEPVAGAEELTIAESDPEPVGALELAVTSVGLAEPVAEAEPEGLGDTEGASRSEVGSAVGGFQAASR